MLKIFIVVQLIILLLQTNNLNANDWMSSGGSDLNHQYSELEQINKSNLKDLVRAWEIKSNEKKYYEVQTNPIYFDGYLINVHNRNLVFINIDNGKIEYELKLEYPIAQHGMTVHDSIIYIPTGKGIALVDFKSKKLLKIIGNLPYFLSPVLTKNEILSVSLNGIIESRDISTHNLNWTTSLSNENVSARVWSGLSYDSNTNQIYVVTSNTNDLIGKNIGEKGGYACSLLAINASNGKINWQFQDTIHDIWDLDMTGPPLPTFYKNKPAVIGLSKTGNIIYVDAISGQSIFEYSIINTKSSKIKDVNLSKYQKLIHKPKPLISMVYNPNEELAHLDKSNKDYVKHILRNSDYGELYQPISIEKDISMFGLHGGAEWPGGALHPRKNILVVSSNRNPWILRAFYEDSSSYKRKNLYQKNSLYNKSCQLCHGSSLKGYHYNESKGNLYFPPLVGVTKKFNREDFTNIEKFKIDHQFFYNISQYEPLQRYKLSKSIQSRNNSKFEIKSLINNIKFSLDKNYENKIISKISKDDLNNLYDFFYIIDKDIEKNDDFKISGIWQLLLDKEYKPASKPPWGYLNAIDMNTGEYLWKIPNGEMSFNDNYSGSISTGGSLITKSNLVISTGTQDKKFRIIDLLSGEELFNDRLDASGSSPPSTFMHKGCQYIVFNATGSKWFGLGDKKSNQISAYKLKSCNINKLKTRS
ncbi:PQQ-binding-like beta-propeller repeat protein [Methylophilaceae bacterium]|nr:PQQ-binding-like beta-propeller repeat protein [Methylophilaceae bacterium]